MSRYDEENELLEFFRVIMAGKLRANRHKPHWDNLSNEKLLERIDEEVAELKEVVKKNHCSKISLEASDIALYCAMLAWNVTKDERTIDEDKKD
jgi:NTP pyrophosphatase (non-canonical NTP hydrolase)